MSDTGSALSGLGISGLIVFAATILGNAVALLSEILIARSLSPSIYGELSLTYTVVFSIGSIILLGVDEGVTRQWSATDNLTDKYQIASSGILIAICTGFATAIGVVLLRGQIGELINAEYISPHITFFAPYLLVYPVAKVSYSILRGKKQTLPAVLARHIGGKGVAFLTLISFLLIGSDFYGAVAYWVGFPLVMLLLSLFFIRRVDSGPGPSLTLPDAQSAIELWSFSWPLAIGSVIFLLLAQLDIIMIGFFMQSSDVGYYRAIQPLKNAAMIALGAFSFIFLPIASELFNNKKDKKLNQIYTITTKWVLMITIPLILTFGLFASNVVSVFFGAEYLQAAPALTILVFGLFIRTLSGLNGDMSKAINRPRIELYCGLIGLLGNFFLNIFLIPRYGIVGASLATVLGYAFYNGFELIWIHHLCGATPFSTNISKITILMFVTGVVVKYITPSQFGLIGLLSVGLLFIALELIILVGTGSVDNADLDLVRKVESQTNLDLQTIRYFLNKGL